MWSTMAVWYIWISKTLFAEHSRQVKVFVSRIFGIIVRNSHKLVRAFLFVSNHSTWGTEFSAALVREQVLVTATPVLRTIRTFLEIFVANLKIALGVNPFVSNGEPRLNIPPLLEQGLNMHFHPKWDKFWPCDNWDTKNGGKWVKKFGQPWLLRTVQYLIRILTVAIFACVSGQRTSCLFLSFLLIVPQRRLGRPVKTIDNGWKDDKMRASETECGREASGDVGSSLYFPSYARVKTC